MAYMNPQQYLDALTGVSQGRRATIYEDPNEVDPNEILKFTGSAMGRVGTPNFSDSRAASGTYDSIPAQRALTGTTPTSLQKSLEQFSQSQGGRVSPNPLAPGGYSAIPSAAEWNTDTAAGPPQDRTDVGDGGDPQGMMSKIGGFFRRPSGARDLGDALTSLGAGMAAESSRPGGSALAGFASGAEMATQSLARSREEARLEEERAVVAAERAEKARREQAAQWRVREVIDGLGENATKEERGSALLRAATEAAASGDANLSNAIRLIAERYAPPELGAEPAVRYETWDQTVGRAPDGTPTRVRDVIAGPPGTISDRTHFDKDVYVAQISEGVDPATAARNSWRTGGTIVDPVAARAAADEAETRTGQERLDARLGDAAYDGLMLMVTDPATVDPETGETIPGQPNYNDYIMAGAVEQSDGSWVQGTPADPEAWQSFLASLISNAGSETTGFGGKLLGFFGRSVFLRDNPDILMGYTNALNYINPTVRCVSGAQMTNQEAMRYYNALIPAPGDPIAVIELKRRKRDVLTNAMGGPGISDAARQKAREALDLDEDELMVHEHGAFGGDLSGQEAADYYLSRLITAVGITDMTDYSDIRRQVGDTLATDDDPGVFVPRRGN